jgi:predicted RNase H-like HicB family nuclease
LRRRRPRYPGCFSAGDTLDGTLKNAREAIEFHFEGLAGDGSDIPTAQTAAHRQANPEYTGWIWTVAEVDVTKYLGKAETINATLPASRKSAGSRKTS